MSAIKGWEADPKLLRDIKTLVRFREEFSCVICGSQNNVIVHHILPIDDVTCLVCLDRSCHQYVEGRCFMASPNEERIKHLLMLISEYDISDVYKEILSNAIVFRVEKRRIRLRREKEIVTDSDEELKELRQKLSIWITDKDQRS